MKDLLVSLTFYPLHVIWSQRGMWEMEFKETSQGSETKLHVFHFHGDI